MVQIFSQKVEPGTMRLISTDRMEPECSTNPSNHPHVAANGYEENHNLLYVYIFAFQHVHVGYPTCHIIKCSRCAACATCWWSLHAVLGMFSPPMCASYFTMIGLRSRVLSTTFFNLETFLAAHPTGWKAMGGKFKVGSNKGARSSGNMNGIMRCQMAIISPVQNQGLAHGNNKLWRSKKKADWITQPNDGLYNRNSSWRTSTVVSTALPPLPPW